MISHVARVLRIVSIAATIFVSVPRAAAADVVIAEGTEVVLKLAQNVNYRTAKVDDSVEFVLARDLKIADLVLVPAGARALGKVSASRAATLFTDGTPDVDVSITTLKAGDVLVALHGSMRSMGHALEDGTLVRAFVETDTVLHIDGAATPIPSLEVPDGKIRVANGKPVRLMLVETVSSKKAKPGDRIQFRVLDDIRVRDLVVIARGTSAWGTVTEVQSARRTWRSGTLGIKLDSIVLVTGQEAPIDFQTAARGGPTGAALQWGGLIYFTQGLALFALPLAPLQRGEQAVIPKATVVEAFLQGPVLLDRGAVEAAQRKQPKESHGPAFVTFYYPDVPLAVAAQVWCGAVEIGRLPRGRHIRLQLAPGAYSFRVYSDGNAVAVVVTEGADLYLRVAFQLRGAQTAAPSAGFVVMEHDLGVTESGDTQPVEPKDVRDVTQISTADLLAQCPPPKKKKN